MQNKKKDYKKTKKKVKKPEDNTRQGYDEYGDRKDQKLTMRKTSLLTGNIFYL